MAATQELVTKLHDYDNMDGVTAIGRIKAEMPETEIVTMTSFIEEEKVTVAAGVPTIVEQGRNFEVTGPFDGDFATTTLKVEPGG